jgi:hypothetical protein
MKTLEIALGKETKFTFSGNRGIASTDGNSFPGFNLIAGELDK